MKRHIYLLTFLIIFCSSYSSKGTMLSKLLLDEGVSASTKYSRRFFPTLINQRNINFSSEIKKDKQKRIVKISNPCIDGIFQHGFSRPAVLSGFLNAVLELPKEKSIEDIVYLQREMTSSDILSDVGYHFTVDVRCRTREGHHFLVEMQNDFREDYHAKALVEHARMLSQLDMEQHTLDQARRVEKNKGDARKFWKGIQGLYTIVITNKAFPSSNMKNNYPNEEIMEPLLVNPYELRNIKRPERHYGDVPNQIILFMLSNLTVNKPEDLDSPIQRWAYLFQDPSIKKGNQKISGTKEIEDPEIIAGGDQAIKEFIEMVKLENLPPHVRENYERNVRYYKETILEIQERAKKEGIEEGERKTKIQITQNMLKKKSSIKKIESVTGLSFDEIKKIQEEMNKSRK